MKKIIACFMSCLLMFVGLNVNHEAFSYNNPSTESTHERYVVESSGVNCVSDITITAPTLVGTNENGENIYRKNVELKNDFFRTKSGKYISENTLSFCFEYSNSGVKISEEGLKKGENVTKSHRWKTSSSEEVYISPGQGIVSERVGIFKRTSLLEELENKVEIFKKVSLLEDLEFYDAFHIDIICSTDGNVTFNIKSKDALGKNNTEISEVTAKSEKLKDNIIRETFIKDKKNVVKSDLNTNDMYKYITREFHISYTNDEGNLLGETVIEATFRYNPKTREVQCLSTSTKELNGKIDVTMRTGNETRSYGGAYGEIELKYSSGAITKTLEEALLIKCDCSGNIISQFVS